MDKKAFRREMRARMRALDPAYVAESDAAICARLLELPEYRAAKRVFAYFSVGREPDTHAFVRAALDAGKEIYLPVITGDGLMDFARYYGTEPLGESALHIPEPGPDAPRAEPEGTDLLLVPAVSFDPEGYRLGQGGGFYDRFLARCHVFSAGLCREQMLCPQAPREPHDMGVDCVLTEQRVIRCR